ncbi:MAG: toll/interleukin-1 receptor domain-containing protein [Candidatus Methylophosphatis roskildensis]
MTQDAALRVLLLLPGQRDDEARPLGAAIEAAGGGAIRAECLADTSENGLRQRLAAGPVDVLHFCGSGKCNAAARYATLDLSAAAGGRRAVNASHLGTLVAQHARLVVLQLSGTLEWVATPFVAAVLRAQAVPAAIVSAQDGAASIEAAARLYAALASGRTLSEAADAMRNNANALVDSLRVPLQFDAADPDSRLVGVQPAAARVEPAPAPMASATPAPDPARLAGEQHEREMQARLARKRAAGEFDVFLCHNWADKPAVRQIASALKAHGILPWLDEWELPPGQPWQPLLEQQISRIHAAAVFVGDAGVGPWQQQELYGFLREFVSRRAPVIPVLLPGAREEPKLPIFLQAMTWVKLGVADPAPLPRLIWGITGRRPDTY